MSNEYRPLPLSELGFSAKKAEEVTAYFSQSPFEVADICPHILGYDRDDMSDFVTMDDLMRSKANELIEQMPVEPKRVANIIVGSASVADISLMDDRELVKPILFGVDENGEKGVILGGRHRTIALLTAYALSGVDVDSSAFRNMKVRVALTPVDIRLIGADNKSRTYTAIEKISAKAQYQYGIDPTNYNDIKDAFADGTMKLPDFFKMSFVHFQNHLDDVPDVVAALTPDTMGKIAGSFISTFKQRNPNIKHAWKVSEFIIALLRAAWQLLPKALNEAKRVGITNFARESRQVASNLVHLVMQEGNVPVPPVPEAKPKAKKTDAKKNGHKPQPAPVVEEEEEEFDEEEELETAPY